MKRIVLILGLCILSISLLTAQGKSEKPYKVFLLAGQSNMDGCGRSEELPKNYRVHPDNIVTWDNKLKVWVPLGEDSFAAAREKQFGPEIVLSHKLSAAYPDHTIALIKTSAGGTKLCKHWLPEQKMYSRFAGNIDLATGALWMQGESDSETLEMAEAYEENLKLLIRTMQQLTGKDDLPFVMGRISSSLLKETPWVFDYTPVVQEAQEKVAAGDEAVHLINTDKLPTLEDNTHFNTKGQIKLGKAMAKIMLHEIKMN